MSSNLQSYWLIGVPNESKGEKHTLTALNEKISNIAKVYPFSVPSLKVGTLDSLLTLSDELQKLDSYVEQTTKKIERSLLDVWKAEPKTEDSKQSQMAGSGPLPPKKEAPPELKISDRQLSAEQFLEEFHWDDVRYHKRKAINTVAETILKDVTKADEELKAQLLEFNEARTNFIAYEKKESGSLLVKPLGQYIKKEYIVDTEHIISLLIVVPRVKEQEFLDTYELLEDLAAEKELERQKEKERLKKEREEHAKKLQQSIPAESKEENPKKSSQSPQPAASKEPAAGATPTPIAPPPEEKKEKKIECKNVVPRSAFKIYTGPPLGQGLIGKEEEDEFVLYAVLVLKKGVESFKALCRDKRYTIRPFKYDPEEDKSQKEKKKSYEVQTRKLWEYFIRWAKTTYSDVFAAWIHLKAMRAFVESVLRYGLPVDFSAILIKPGRGADKKLRFLLNELYSKLVKDSALTEQLDSSETDISGVGNEFYSYVYLPITLIESQ